MNEAGAVQYPPLQKTSTGRLLIKKKNHCDYRIVMFFGLLQYLNRVKKYAVELFFAFKRIFYVLVRFT